MRERVDMQGKPKPVRAHEREVGKGEKMKSIIISIQPKWCAKIESGAKTIEVRKTRPKIETPFKCYIYESKGKTKYWSQPMPIPYREGGGKVIGEFVCDNIEIVNASCSDYGIDLFYYDCKTKGCLNERDVEKYFNIPKNKDLRVMKGNGYAWNISELKIYDKPKELGEFWAYNEELNNQFENEENFCCYDGTNEYGELINECAVFNKNITRCYSCWEEWSGWCHRITRPPQSWCYVEELED